MKPRLLDLFCGQGGAGMGYHRAGFDVTGVDIEPQPRYPFGFVQADALLYLRDHGHRFDMIHASPPCHDHSRLSSQHADDGTAWLLDATRTELVKLDVPWVIENVPGAPMHTAVTLCGSMFDLGVRRHRLFESSERLVQPDCQHDRQERVITVTGHPGGSSRRDGSARYGSTADWREAMGIDWMTAEGMAQAIPPAYTEYIGFQLVDQIVTGRNEQAKESA